MNTELQKKWFVYLSDHHEGPFDAAELSEKKSSGLISQQSYVWAEGMADWKPLVEVTELSTAMRKIETTREGKKTGNAGSRFAHSLKAFRKIRFFKPGTVLTVFVLISIISVSLLSRFAGEELHSKMRPILNRIVSKAPFLSFAFNLIPNARELDSNSRKEMEEALSGDPAAGVKFSATLLQSDPSRPMIYVATNLPDRTRLIAYVIGNSETLLNRLNHQSQIQIQTFRGIGKSEVLLSDDGQPLAKGEYIVWITESLDQEETVLNQLNSYPANRPSGTLPQPIPNTSKFVLRKTFFIGGNRDENYLTRLKAFHEKIRQNSEKEVVELRQYSDTLALQFQTLTAEFGKIVKTKKLSNGQKENWKSTSKKWMEINSQLEQTIQTWSKETLQNEFFHGNAFELVKSTYESIRNLHSIENEFVDKPTDRNAFEIQYGKAVNECRLSLNQLKAKIDAILNAPKSSTGLPKREGV